MTEYKQMVILLCLLVFPIPVTAADAVKGAAEKGKQVPAPAATVAKAPVDKPSYKPPLRGAPAGRVGGGTRGATERESFSLLVLAPDHVGYTTQDQPCLYWFISKPTSYSVELTVSERKAVTPLMEKVLKGPEKAGILVQKRRPDLEVDGEMQFNTAANPELMKELYPFCRLKGRANVFIFPNLDAGNSCYKAIAELGDAEVVGPILMGLKRPVEVLQRADSVDAVVRLVSIATVEAQGGFRRELV